MQTHKDLIRASIETARTKDFQGNAWGARHAAAFSLPRGPEIGVVGLVHALAAYADNHFRTYDSTIGEDGFLGPRWADMIRNARALLNGDCGRLDCGTLDGLLCDMLVKEGFEVDG